MNEFHKELLSEFVKDWDVVQLDTYIHELEQRQIQLSNWITHVRKLRRKKVRKPVYDTGVRGGA